MTTGLGAQWDAPCKAYEYTAAVATGDRGEAEVLLGKLDRPGLTDLVTALAAHARNAAWAASQMAAGVRLQQSIDVYELTAAACPAARDWAAVAVAGAAPRPPAPRCLRCLRLVAAALAEVQLRQADAVGYPRAYVAAVCRRAAAAGGRA